MASAMPSPSIWVMEMLMKAKAPVTTTRIAALRTIRPLWISPPPMLALLSCVGDSVPLDFPSAPSLDTRITSMQHTIG